MKEDTGNYCYYHDLQQCVPVVRINWSEVHFVFQFQMQALNGRSLGKTNMKHCEITCQFELNVRLCTTESAVEFNFTLDQ
jgi:hypothetical protein